MQTDNLLEEAVDQLRKLLEGLRFGQVTLFIQDGVLVQVERTEKIRPARLKKESR
jgi:hypothetical protein